MAFHNSAAATNDDKKSQLRLSKTMVFIVIFGPIDEKTVVLMVIFDQVTPWAVAMRLKVAKVASSD